MLPLCSSRLLSFHPARTFNQKIMSVGAIEARHVAILAPLVAKQDTPDGAFQSTASAASPTV